MTGQILPGLHLGKPPCSEQTAHRIGLLPAVLQQEPAARLQIRRSCLNDMTDVAKAVRPTDQCRIRLETHIALDQGAYPAGVSAMAGAAVTAIGRGEWFGTGWGYSFTQPYPDFDIERVAAYAKEAGLEIPVVHGPYMLLLRNVLGSDYEEKSRRSLEVAGALGAETMVAHAPFRWERKALRWVAEELGVGLCVLGTDVRPGSERLFLGPRVERILEDAPCPVLVVPVEEG